MARRARRNHGPVATAKVALAAVNGAKTLTALARQFDVHPEPLLSARHLGDCAVGRPGGKEPVALDPRVVA